MSQVVYAVGTPDQATVSMTYDSNQNPATYTNELGQTTSFVFDNSDRKVGEQDPPPDPNQPGVRPTWAWVFDTRGNQLSELDPMNRLTQRVYGPGSDGDEPDLDQIIQPDPAGGTNYTVTTLNHDNAENITSVLDPMQRSKAKQESEKAKQSEARHPAFSKRSKKAKQESEARKRSKKAKQEESEARRKRSKSEARHPAFLRVERQPVV